MTIHESERAAFERSKLPDPEPRKTRKTAGKIIDELRTMHTAAVREADDLSQQVAMAKMRAAIYVDLLVKLDAEE